MGQHPEAPWSPMRGIRNKVVHDYFDIAWDVVWNTVKDDLPPLKRQIDALLETLAAAGNSPGAN